MRFGRAGSIPHAFSRTGSRVGVDTESGKERDSLPVQRGAARRAAMARGCRAKRPARLPVVLTKDEVRRVLAEAHGTSGLVLRLLYGTGMRVLEALRLR